MFNNLQDLSVEFKLSRTQKMVPVISEVHLHSIYDPEKEAGNFASSYEDKLKVKNHAFVLGLGFGYHLEAITKILQKYHGDNFKVFILEPNINVFQKFLDEGKQLDERMRVFAGTDIEAFYRNKDLIRFLSGQPMLIPHGPSFNLYKSFFKAFMSYEASSNLQAVVKEMEPSPIKDFLTQQDTDSSLDGFFSVINNKKPKSDLEYLLMAFNSITQNHDKDDSEVSHERHSRN